MFIDGNNWYHSVKRMVKPRLIDFEKLAALVAEHFDLEILEIRYYNSVPDIGLGEENYYKHMVFLGGLEVTVPHSHTATQPLRRLSDRTHSVNPPFLGLSSPSGQSRSMSQGCPR